MHPSPKIVIAGHPLGNIVTRTHAEPDLTNQAEVQTFFAQEQPDHVYPAAAKVGGVQTKLLVQAVKSTRFKLRYDDLSYSSNLTRTIQQTQPEKICNLAMWR